MREIKYQVYDNKLKMMFEVIEISRLEHSAGYVKGRKADSGGEYYVTEGYLDKKMGLSDGKQIHRFNLRQYTGSKDKNGKEIYEGDIVRVRRPGRDQQTHYGDNIPLGSYTEPLEAIIHEYETEVKFLDGIFGCEVEDTDHVPLLWIMADGQATDEQQLKEMFSGGWGDRIFEGWEDDKGYLFEKHGVSTVDELIQYIGMEVISNIHETPELLQQPTG